MKYEYTAVSSTKAKFLVRNARDSASLGFFVSSAQFELAMLNRNDVVLPQ